MLYLSGEGGVDVSFRLSGARLERSMSMDYGRETILETLGREDFPQSGKEKWALKTEEERPFVNEDHSGEAQLILKLRDSEVGWIREIGHI